MMNGGKGIYTLGYVPRTDTKVVRAFLGSVPEIRLIDGETKSVRIRLWRYWWPHMDEPGRKETACLGEVADGVDIQTNITQMVKA